MTAWEYLFLEVRGHNKSLFEAQNMLVTTSGGRWHETRMPKDVIGIVNQLGADGWEMVGSGAEGYETPLPRATFDAEFKRPKS